MPQDPLLKGQRCVILADGFYEWRRQQKDKQPFFIYFPQGQGEKQNEIKKEEECEREPGVRRSCNEMIMIHSGWNCICRGTIILTAHHKETGDTRVTGERHTSEGRLMLLATDIFNRFSWITFGL